MIHYQDQILSGLASCPIWSWCPNRERPKWIRAGSLTPGHKELVSTCLASKECLYESLPAPWVIKAKRRMKQVGKYVLKNTLRSLCQPRAFEHDCLKIQPTLSYSSFCQTKPLHYSPARTLEYPAWQARANLPLSAYRCASWPLVVALLPEISWQNHCRRDIREVKCKAIYHILSYILKKKVFVILCPSRVAKRFASAKSLRPTIGCRNKLELHKAWRIASLTSAALLKVLGEMYSKWWEDWDAPQTKQSNDILTLLHKCKFHWLRLILKSFAIQQVVIMPPSFENLRATCLWKVWKACTSHNPGPSTQEH